MREAERLRNQNQLCASRDPTSLFEGSNYLVVKEVSEDALPKTYVLNARAAPDYAVQKNIEYIKNIAKIRADRERKQKEYLEREAADALKKNKKLEQDSRQELKAIKADKSRPSTTPKLNQDLLAHFDSSKQPIVALISK